MGTQYPAHFDFRVRIPGNGEPKPSPFGKIHLDQSSQRDLSTVQAHQDLGARKASSEANPKQTRHEVCSHNGVLLSNQMRWRVLQRGRTLTMPC